MGEEDDMKAKNAPRVLCCGGRNWGDVEGDSSLILARLRLLPTECVLVHGACRGADRMCAEAAQRLNASDGWRFMIEEYPAKWTEFGRAAGLIRNKMMLSTGIDLVLAFHHDLASSKGTADMVRRAKLASVPVEVIG